jgi:hypothetical protein
MATAEDSGSMGILCEMGNLRENGGNVLAIGKVIAIGLFWRISKLHPFLPVDRK